MTQKKELTKQTAAFIIISFAIIGFISLNIINSAINSQSSKQLEKTVQELEELTRQAIENSEQYEANATKKYNYIGFRKLDCDRCYEFKYEYETKNNETYEYAATIKNEKITREETKLLAEN